MQDASMRSFSWHGLSQCERVGRMTSASPIARATVCGTVGNAGASHRCCPCARWMERYHGQARKDSGISYRMSHTLPCMWFSFFRWASQADVCGESALMI